MKVLLVILLLSLCGCASKHAYIPDPPQQYENCSYGGTAPQMVGRMHCEKVVKAAKADVITTR